MSPAGLKRLHDRMAWHVETGKLPGLITLVAGHEGAENDVHVDVIGTKAIDDDTPMPRDAIFRIASLTKPITAAAAMLLVDDGVLELDGAVDEYLPELADRRVLRSLEGPLDDTVPAERAITLDDLLTYRMGFGAIMVPPDTYPIQTAEAALQLRHARATVATDAAHPGRMDPALRITPPDPPARRAVDVQHRLAGARHPVGTRRRPAPRSVPAPTAVRAARDARHRVQRVDRSTQPFHHRLRARPRNGRARRLDGVEDSYWSQPPAMPNAAGWLVSTVDDFWAFVSMLLADGISTASGSSPSARSS